MARLVPVRTALRVGAVTSLALFCLLACTGADSAVAPLARSLPERTRMCVLGSPEICWDGVDNNCNGLADEGCGEPSTEVTFVAAWSEKAVDVDLRVFDPRGHLVEFGTLSDSGLEKVLDCPSAGRPCLGGNRERVVKSSDKKPLAGRYDVVVRLEALAGSDPPVEVAVSARLGPRAFSAVVQLRNVGDEVRLSWTL